MIDIIKNYYSPVVQYSNFDYLTVLGKSEGNDGLAANFHGFGQPCVGAGRTMKVEPVAALNYLAIHSVQPKKGREGKEV